MRIKRGVKKIIEKFSFVKFSVFMLFLLVIMSTMVVPKIKADDEDTSKSFYMMSSAAASYMNFSQEPKAPGATALKELGMGDAGGLMAYVDTDTPGFTEYIASKISTAATSNTYKSLLDASTGDGAHTNSLYYYARYGYLLNATGLDETGGKTDGFIRMIAGAPLWFVYQLAQAVPTIFSIVLTVLRTLNVFNLFATGFNKATSGLRKSGTYTSEDSPAKSILDDIRDRLGQPRISDKDVIDRGLIEDNGDLMTMDGTDNVYTDAAETVSGTYRAAYQWGWEIAIPIALIALAAGIFLFREDGKKRFSRIKKLFLRAIMITFGVPICGALYTEALDWVSQAVGDGMASTATVVTSTLCDFEGWVEHSRLAVPEDVVLVSQGAEGTLAGEPSGDTYSNLRSTCYTINSQSGLSPGLQNSAETVDWDGATVTKTNSVNTTREDMKRVVTLIERYMHADTYESASFESSTKAWLSSQTASDDDYATAVDEMMENSLETTQFCGDTDEETDANTADEDAKEAAKNRFNDSCDWNNAGSSNMSANVWNNGGLKAKSTSGKIGSTSKTEKLSRSTTLGDKIGNLIDSNTKIVYSSTYDEDVEDGGSHVDSVGGLSTVAMYNYLNSDFSKSEVTMYSAKRSTSLFTKPSHYSVTLIGNGALAALYWINAMVMLLSVVIIGYWYALAILFNAFKVSMEIIFNVPFMVMGMLKSGIKVLVFTFVLIIELVGTMFLYTVVTDIIFNIGGIVDKAASTQLGNTIIFGGGVYADISATFKGTLMLTVIKLILSSLVIIVLTIKALQVRKGLIKGMNEMMQQTLERLLLDGDSTGAMNDLGKPSALGSLAKGVAKGVGMAKGMAKDAKGKSPRKGPQAADAQMAGAIMGNNNADGEIDLDEKDRLAQENREGLPGPTDGQDGADNDETKGLPGPTGDSDGGAGNRLPGPTDGGDPESRMEPAMAGGDTESDDKQLADKLKNVDSLGDVDKSDDKDGDKETKPVDAAKEDKEGKEKAVKGQEEDPGSEGKDGQKDANAPDGEKTQPDKDGESQEKGVGAVSPDSDTSKEQSSTDGQSGEESESTSKTKDVKESEAEQKDKPSADSKDGNKESQNGQANRGKPSENPDGKTEKGRSAGKPSSEKASENSSSRRPKDIKGQAASGASGSAGSDNTSQKPDNTLRRVHAAAKQMKQDNSYKQSRLKSGLNIDKDKARQDGIIYSRTAKCYVDSNNRGKHVRAFKDVNQCYNDMMAQGKGRITELNGCSAKIKGNDMIITKKMANGGKTQFTVDRATGMVKEQRYSESFMKQRYKKEKKRKK